MNKKEYLNLLSKLQKDADAIKAILGLTRNFVHDDNTMNCRVLFGDGKTHADQLSSGLFDLVLQSKKLSSTAFQNKKKTSERRIP